MPRFSSLTRLLKLNRSPDFDLSKDVKRPSKRATTPAVTFG